MIVVGILAAFTTENERRRARAGGRRTDASKRDPAPPNVQRVRVLVAEDVQRVAQAVARGLRREGAAVDVAFDGASALAKARAFDYDVLVLDRDLPELHGDAVCEAVHREQPETRILMLTAYGE